MFRFDCPVVYASTILLIMRFYCIDVEVAFIKSFIDKSKYLILAVYVDLLLQVQVILWWSE